VLLAPFVLIVLMPGMASKIVDFVRSMSVTVPKVGTVCGYSLFSLKKYGAWCVVAVACAAPHSPAV
jgi:hypothetical protein